MWSLCVLLVSVTALILASSLGHTSHAKEEKIIYDLNDAKKLFQEFLQTYEKTVEGEEYNTRLEVFKMNLQEINELNKEHESAVFGITQFADMTYKEWSRVNGLIDSSEHMKCANYTGPYDPAPASLDYRDKNMVSPVKDQRSCGSCYAFSALGAVEGAYAKKTGKLISFSAQQIVDCASHGCFGCLGGLIPYAYSYVHESGIEPESDYPYIGWPQDCHYDQLKIQTKVSSCTRIYVPDEETLTSALDKFGPLSIAVFANKAWRHYKGGTLKINCPAARINHGVLLVGYGTENGTDYWLVKNSWGDKWGDKGYIKLKRGKNMCNLLHMVTAAEV